MKMDTKDLEWYEDGSFLEWYVGTDPVKDRKIKKCTLEQAIEFAWKNKMCLYIQPEMQDAGLSIDYSE